MPDGTFLTPAQGGFDTACNSNMISRFNTIYGAGVWQAELQRVWDDWMTNSGNIYSPAVPVDSQGTPVDDGASWPAAPGQLGVRGDIRLGGCTIDGNGGTLAYAYFPNIGDMKIDTNDNFYVNAGLSPGLHNVVSHEHGHAIALEHVCPIDQTKLMEPFISTQFLGLQHDDIRGVQRAYGDRFELVGANNNARSRATELSFSQQGGEQVAFEEGLSIDDNGDVDWFEFDAVAGDQVDVLVEPRGFTYLEDEDPPVPFGASACSTSNPTPINSLAIQDLQLQLRRGSSILATVNTTGTGLAEALNDFDVPSDGTYQLRVRGVAANDVQLYDLRVAVDQPGATAPVTIGNRVWHDLNENGRAGSGEPGVGGVPVTVRDGNGVVIDTTTTSATGYWTSEVNPDIALSIEIDVPVGFEVTEQQAGTNPNIDSDADANGVIQLPAGTLSAGVDDKTLDVGLVSVGAGAAPATIGNRVWHDLNENGRAGSGEPGISGVKVRLLDNTGLQVAVTTTSATGYWTLEIDPTQSYTVKVVPPSGFSVTDRQVGSNPNIDSDANSSNNILLPAGTLASGDVDKTLDVGMID